MRRRIRVILTSTANGSMRVVGLFSPSTVAVLAGAALTVIGLHLVYPPLAYIVPGVTLVIGGLWLAGLPLTRSRE